MYVDADEVDPNVDAADGDTGGGVDVG